MSQQFVAKKVETPCSLTEKKAAASLLEGIK